MLRALTRLGVSRGLLGGSRLWLVLGTAAVAVRALAKLAVKEPEVVFREDLPAGQSLVITHVTQPL